MKGPGRLLDACVLIDFCRERPSLLGSVAESLGPVFVTYPVLGEVRQLDERSCNHLGLRVYQLSLVQLEQAAQRNGALSLADRSCL